MDNQTIKKALRQCIVALRQLHPVMDPDEPCICLDAYEFAKQVLKEIDGEDRCFCPICDTEV